MSAVLLVGAVPLLLFFCVAQLRGCAPVLAVHMYGAVTIHSSTAVLFCAAFLCSPVLQKTENDGGHWQQKRCLTRRH